LRPIKLKSALSSLLKGMEIYDSYKKQRAIIIWPEVCGKKVAEISRAVSLKGTQLFIDVKDHIWASELTHMQMEYLEAYEKLLGSSLLGVEDVFNWKALLSALKNPATNDKKRIVDLLDEKSAAIIKFLEGGAKPGKAARRAIVSGLNKIIRNRAFYTSAAFGHLKLNYEIGRFLKKGIQKLERKEVQIFNRRLFEAAFPGVIVKCSGIVSKIYFRVNFQSFSKSKKKSIEKYDLESVKLTKKERKKIDSVLSEVKDSETRDLAERILVRAEKFEKWLLKHGGRKCLHCGVVIEPEMSFCPICTRYLEKQNIGRLKTAMESKPWLTYPEAVTTISPLSYNLYSSIRSDMIDELRSVINNLIAKDRGKLDISVIRTAIITLAMMRTGKQPSQLNDRAMMECLSGNMFKFYKDKSIRD